MVIAGDPSGDLAAAELVRALRRESRPFEPRFLGAGGPAMREAGVVLLHDLTEHSVIGLEILRKLAVFRRVFSTLRREARAQTVDAVIGVDYSGFNLRFAEAIARDARRHMGPFQNWRPRRIQYISPQVWASRPGRARRMEACLDLLLSILPFEADWFATRAPRLRVVHVGHPLADRHPRDFSSVIAPRSGTPLLVLLPGSRPGELERHLPVMVPAAQRVRQETGARIRLILPRASLEPIAQRHIGGRLDAEVQLGGLAEGLRNASVAMASTGTVTLECAWHGVPTVALYRTSPVTYAVGRRIVTVKHLAMPNILAGGPVIPEFVQDEATPDRLAEAAIGYIQDPETSARTRRRLLDLASTLGDRGTADRAAAAIQELLGGVGCAD
jgi:lipid-A-disaccharide synthase